MVNRLVTPSMIANDIIDSKPFIELCEVIKEQLLTLSDNNKLPENFNDLSEAQKKFLEIQTDKLNDVLYSEI